MLCPAGAVLCPVADSIVADFATVMPPTSANMKACQKSHFP